MMEPKKQGLSVSLGIKTNLSLTNTLAEKKKYWDDRLDRTMHRWPLAPTHLVESGQVNDDNYSSWSKFWRDETANYMRKKFSIMAATTIYYIGYGEGDDNDWMPFAITRGHKVVIIDLSDVSIDNALEQMEKFKTQNVPTQEVEILQADIDSVVQGTTGFLEPITKGLLYLSKVAENLNENEVQLVFMAIGTLLSKGADVILVHPFAEQNPGFFSKHAVPHSRKTILRALSEGAGREVRFAPDEREIQFYDRIYVACSPIIT